MLDFYVREVIVAPDSQFAFNGSDSAVFTCTAVGDTISSVSWTGTPGVNNATVSVEGSFSNKTFTWESELTVGSAIEVDDYTCIAAYSAGGKQSHTATLNVIGNIFTINLDFVLL